MFRHYSQVEKKLKTKFFKVVSYVLEDAFQGKTIAITILSTLENRFFHLGYPSYNL